MKASVIPTVAALLFALPAPWSRGVAQERDSTAPRRPRVVAIESMPAVLTIDTLALVIVSPDRSRDTLSVWTTGSAVAATTGLKPAHLAPRGQLVDRRHAALSTLPPDLLVGYVVAAPGLAPLLVRGAVPRAALEDSVRLFLTRHRALRR